MYKKILGFVFILAFFVRLWGIYPGFPNYHPDEPQIYSRALLILQNKEETLGYWGYPSLTPLINSFFYAIFFIPLTLIFKVSQNPMILKDFVNTGQFLQKYIFGIQEINVLYWGRIVNAILGGLTVIFTYLVAKKYFNKTTGFLAALFLTFNTRHVLGSHFALPDVPNSFFLLIPLFFSFNILKGGKVKDYFWAGITSALSMSVKLSPFSLIPTFLSHLFSPMKLISKNSFVKLLVILITFICVILIINVFHLFHLDALSHDLDKLDKRYLVGSNKLFLYPYSYLYHQGIGPLLTIFSFIGMFNSLFKNIKKTLVLISPVLFMFFTLTYYSIGGVYVRNFIAIIPLILIFSAVGIEFVFKKNWILGSLLTFFAIVSSVNYTVTLGIDYSKEWNVKKMQTYLKGKFENENIAATSWFGAFFQIPQKNLINWHYDSNFNLSELQDEKTDYAVIDTDVFEAMTSWWMTIRGLNAPLTPPENILYSTFPIASAKELLSNRIHEITKTPLVPETNFYITRIPKQSEFKGIKILSEDFNKSTNWKLNNPDGKMIPNTKQIFDKKCGGCIQIGQIKPTDSSDAYLLSSGVSRSFAVKSEPIPISEFYEYKVSADVWNHTKIEKNQRDGFIKIELYKNKMTAETDKSGDLVFLSERYFFNSKEEVNLQKRFFVPEGYSYATISFQVDRNRNGDFYFDNLSIEKSVDKNLNLEKLKEFPEEIFFKDSIL